MGLWSRFKEFFATPTIDPQKDSASVVKKSAAKRKSPARVVRVAPLYDRFTGEERGGGWAYFYRAEGLPSFGQRVIVQFGFEDKEEELRINGLGRNGYNEPLNSITNMCR